MAFRWNLYLKSNGFGWVTISLIGYVYKIFSTQISTSYSPVSLSTEYSVCFIESMLYRGILLRTFTRDMSWKPAMMYDRHAPSQLGILENCEFSSLFCIGPTCQSDIHVPDEARHWWPGSADGFDRYEAKIKHTNARYREYAPGGDETNAIGAMIYAFMLVTSYIIHRMWYIVTIMNGDWHIGDMFPGDINMDAPFRWVFLTQHSYYVSLLASWHPNHSS